eukprot:TRINITY_DN5952_c0_g1_i3.p1 TRINITY_DN5952_c0_g1~~TRINITY_DN5952_c0_g1_i3.p1  ORF type:complete len:127 (-),score=31.29 TRINITY_DN5952_c0_g1_i3:167-547(-)
MWRKFITAISKGNIDAMYFFIEKGVSPSKIGLVVSSFDRIHARKVDALYASIVNNRTEIVQILLEMESVKIFPHHLEAIRTVNYNGLLPVQRISNDIKILIENHPKGVDKSNDGIQLEIDPYDDYL